MNGKSYSDFFDDDFEVVYEEDLPEININDDDNDDEDEEYGDRSRGSSASRKSPGSGKDKRERSGRDGQEDGRSRSRSRSRHSVLSPVKKTAQTGARAAARLIQVVCKTASLVLIAVITLIWAPTFWRGSSPTATRPRPWGKRIIRWQPTPPLPSSSCSLKSSLSSGP